MTYTIRHTDYINCRYSGKIRGKCDTAVAGISPYRKEWKVFRSEAQAQKELWKIRMLQTSRAFEKINTRHPHDSKWVIVENPVDNV